MSPAVLRVREMVAKELRQLFRDVRTRGMMFVAPVIQLVVFGYAVNSDIRNTATIVVDRDRTAESRALLDAFTASGYFEIVAVAETPTAIVDALDHGDAMVGLEIPPGFARDLAAGRGVVQIVMDGTQSDAATTAQGYTQRIVQAYARGRLAAQGIAAPGGPDLRLRAWYNPNLESRVYNVPGVIAIVILLMALLLTSLAVVREREIGTLDQLRVSPLRPGELILGKTLPVALIALLDLALISSIAVFWFDIPLRGSPLVLLPSAILYILAGLGFGLLISTVSNTQQEAFMAMFLFLLPAIILSGFFYPISSMPPVFQHLTLLNPVRHFLVIVRAVFLKGEGYATLWPQFLALAALASASLGVAVWRFARREARGD